MSGVPPAACETMKRTGFVGQSDAVALFEGDAIAARSAKTQSPGLTRPSACR
jgi:hypothetical protein